MIVIEARLKTTKRSVVINIFTNVKTINKAGSTNGIINLFEHSLDVSRTDSKLYIL